MTYVTYCSKRINKQRVVLALRRKGTQQQRPESPTATAPGMRVNTGYQRYMSEEDCETEAEWTEKTDIRNAEFLAAGEACKAISYPPLVERHTL